MFLLTYLELHKRCRAIFWTTYMCWVTASGRMVTSRSSYTYNILYAICLYVYAHTTAVKSVQRTCFAVSAGESCELQYTTYTWQSTATYRSDTVCRWILQYIDSRSRWVVARIVHRDGTVLAAVGTESRRIPWRGGVPRYWTRDLPPTLRLRSTVPRPHHSRTRLFTYLFICIDTVTIRNTMNVQCVKQEHQRKYKPSLRLWCRCPVNQRWKR